MLKSSELIWHDGKVIETHKDRVKVVIESTSACSDCHSKEACPISETERKVIEVKDIIEDFLLGDEVIVYFEEKMGFLALLLGYIIPFVILFSVLLTSFAITGKELESGIFSIVILIPYYFGLYLFRNKIQKSFIFKVSKKNI